MTMTKIREVSTLLDHMKKIPNPNSNSLNRKSIPLPHRTIPVPAGQDHDFISVAHSHLIHSEWPKLEPFAPKLTPFRTNHILIKLRKDPVLSLQFYNFALARNPNCLSLETHAIVLHILTKFKRFRSAELILRDNLIPRTLRSSSALFDSILYSYRMCDSSPSVLDSLFKAYAHMKKFRNASDTFCRMRDYGFLPTVRSCNAYMSSLLNLKRTDIVLGFYREMGRCRISPNVFTLNIVMCALCDSGKLEKALEIFRKMESMGISPIVSSFNTLIDAYCKNGLMTAAMKLKNEMSTRGLIPSLITYNTLIHGFCKVGKLSEANKIFSEMKSMEVKPNIVTYNTLISGYSQMNNVEMGLRIFGELMKDGVEADIITYNTLILGLCNEGKTKKAAYLVKELDKAKLFPNSSTFSALIHGQCNRQNSERAVQVYKVMTKSGCHPNYNTFKALISTFCKNEDFEGALEIMRDMLMSWITPDKALLMELFDGLNRSGQIHLATKFLSDVDGRRLIPEDFHGFGISSTQV